MLNERIKNLRLAKGLTLQQVGDAFGISAASVASWEKGKNQPDSRKISQLAEVLGTTVGFLLNGHIQSLGYAIESPTQKVPFFEWNQLGNLSSEKIAQSDAQPLHSNLSSSSFATRFPGSNSLNWHQGPIPAGALVFIDPRKLVQTEGIVLVRLLNNQLELARVQMPDKSSGLFLKLIDSGTTVVSPKDAQIIGSIVEWRITGVL